MFLEIKNYCNHLVQNFDKIPAERKKLLEKLTDYIQKKIDNKEKLQLVFICTHNSRRSHFGQVWAAVAAAYFQIPDVFTFSGGTEARAFHTNAINALNKIGFKVEKESESINPVYKVAFSEEGYLECFSKVYDDEANPKNNFAAIMTCSDAEENCPFIPGVELRIATTYNDPKEFDNTPQQDEKYTERSEQIATELLYVFSKVKV